MGKHGPDQPACLEKAWIVCKRGVLARVLEYATR